MNNYEYKYPKSHNKKYILLISIVFISIISMFYKYKSFHSKVIESNSPTLTTMWSTVGKNDRATAYVDINNLHKLENNEVEFWEKMVFLENSSVNEEMNQNMPIDLNEIDTILTHYLVNCTKNTLQTQKMLFTLKNGKVRPMETKGEKSPPIEIPKDSLILYSTALACQLKDMSHDERVLTLNNQLAP